MAMPSQGPLPALPGVSGALVGGNVSLGVAGGGRLWVANSVIDQAAGGAAGGSVGGGRIEIDVERAPEVVHGLDDILADLREMRSEARVLAQVKAPGLDAFSAYAAQSISEVAEGGPGNHADAQDAYINILAATRDRLVEAFTAYKGADAAAAAGLTSTEP